jgi:hypothetical protein
MLYASGAMARMKSMPPPETIQVVKSSSRRKLNSSSIGW